MLCTCVNVDECIVVREKTLQQDWKYWTEWILIIDEKWPDSEQLWVEYMGATYGDNKTIGFMIYRSSLPDNSIPLNVLVCIEIMWYSATQLQENIKRCVDLSGLEPRADDVKFKSVRLTCQQKGHDKLKIIIKENVVRTLVV